MTNRKWLARGIACAAIGALTFTAVAAKPTVGGAFSFEPITGSAVVGSLPANAPFKLPAGFSQEVVSDELGLFSDGLNIYTSNDWPDMTQSNETGKWSGRYLYRTHEVRPPPANANGAVSVIDLETGGEDPSSARTRGADGLVDAGHAPLRRGDLAAGRGPGLPAGRGGAHGHLDP
jgi:hypothetical protein